MILTILFEYVIGSVLSKKMIFKRLINWSTSKREDL